MADALPGCPDCAAQPGQPHDDGCDVARCLASGVQRLGCGCHDCGHDVWSGRWPGDADAERLGWYAYFVPNGNPSWVPCAADHPGARPDLNRLQIEGRWNPELLRWEAR